MAKKFINQVRVAPGEKVDLSKRSTTERFGWTKDEALAELEHVKARLDLLQQRLYAQDQRSVLLVIQAMDAAGKDGTIRSILSGLNPAGVSVAAFKAPGGREAQHDYLWRVHEACPEKGMIGVFNRSHYEDVLVVRVKQFVPKAQWSKRYRHINEFERMLSDEGTTIVKCFLHVSKEMQAQRFQDRLDDPEKRWKFRAGDLEDRALWPKFQKAYEDVLEQTSTKWAPWHVIPADSNSTRNLAVAKVLLSALEGIDPQLPPDEANLDDIVIK
jgi:PPK2 family polyphosphate:nucleotide phosphotransferase